MSGCDIPSIFEIINAVDAAVSVIDRNGKIVFVNRNWIDFGDKNGSVKCESGVGVNYIDVCERSKDKNTKSVIRGLRRLLSDDGPYHPFEHEYPCHSNTQKRWFLMVAKRLVIEPGKPFVVIIHYDITRRKLAEQRAERLSQHDPLTGLANRRLFNEFMKIEWRRAVRGQSPITFMMIDIDHFKSINDSNGHQYGDKCLKMVAAVLAKFSRRPSDLAARIGGEEFALVMVGVELPAAIKAAEFIRHAIGKRFVDGQRLTVSIGVALQTPDPNINYDDLMRSAVKWMASRERPH